MARDCGLTVCLAGLQAREELIESVCHKEIGVYQQVRKLSSHPWAVQ